MTYNTVRAHYIALYCALTVFYSYQGEKNHAPSPICVFNHHAVVVDDI